MNKDELELIIEMRDLIDRQQELIRKLTQK